jgi:ATP-dependent DNA helicase RecG
LYVNSSARGWDGKADPDRWHATARKASDLDILAGLRLIHVDGFLTRAGEILLCRSAGSAPDEILVYQYRQMA